jgi:hypothetical protein
MRPSVARSRVRPQAALALRLRVWHTTRVPDAGFIVATARAAHPAAGAIIIPRPRHR